VRLRKFVIRSFCRSARVKTEEGWTIHKPSIHHLFTISLDGKWGGGGLYQGARSGSELIAVTLTPLLFMLSSVRGRSKELRGKGGLLELN